MPCKNCAHHKFVDDETTKTIPAEYGQCMAIGANEMATCDAPVYTKGDFSCSLFEPMELGPGNPLKAADLADKNIFGTEGGS